MKYSKMKQADLLSKLKALLLPAQKRHYSPKQFKLVEFLFDEKHKEKLKGELFWGYNRIGSYLIADKTAITRLRIKILNKLFKDDSLWIQIFIEETAKGLKIIDNHEEIYLAWLSYLNEEKKKRAKKNKYKELEEIESKIHQLKIRYITLFPDFPKIHEKVQPKDQRVRDPISEYLNKTAEKYRYLETRHLGIIFPSDNAMELCHIYIHLKATGLVPSTPVFPITEYTKWRSGINRQLIDSHQIIIEGSKTSKTDEILKRSLNFDDRANRRILFLGSPGNGKTTLLRHIAFSVASGNAEPYGLNGFIPVFVDLGKYCRSPIKGLLDYALSEVRIPIVDEGERISAIQSLRSAIREYGKHGRVIFLLDALDEAISEIKRIVDEIESLANQNENFVFVVTSRPISYYKYPLTTFSHYMIQDIKTQDQKEFIHSWFDIYSKQKTVVDPETDPKPWSIERPYYLIEQISNKPNIERIASNPLYLTFLTFMASDPDKKALPGTVADLYLEYFFKLIVRWEEKHELPSSPDVLLKGFREICYIMHRLLYSDWQGKTYKNIIKDKIDSHPSIDTDLIFDFWIRAGVFFSVKTKGREMILPQHASFLDFGFAWKMARLYDNSNNKSEVWESTLLNLHNKYLYEPLKCFIGLIDEPAVFIKQLMALENDIFRRTMFILSDLVCEVKDKLCGRGILSDFIWKLYYIWNSINVYDFWVRREAEQCIGCLLGSEDYRRVLDVIDYGRIKYKKILGEAISNIENGTNNLHCLKKAFKNEPDTDYVETFGKIIADRENKKVATNFFKNIYSKSNRVDKREIILYFLNKIRAVDSIPFLMEKLKEEHDPILRKKIIDCICKLNGKKNIKFLKDTFENEKDLDVKIFIADRIGRIAKDYFAIEYYDLLYKKNIPLQLRKEIVTLVCQINPNKSIILLKKFLKIEDDIKHKQQISHWIGKIGDQAFSISYSMKLYNQTDDRNVKIDIQNMFGWFRAKTTIPFLKKRLKVETDFYTKKIIIRSIGNIEGSDSIPFFRALFKKEKDFGICLIIANEIGRQGNKKLAADYLEKLFQNPSNVKKKKCILREFKSVKLNLDHNIDILKNLFEKEEDPSIRPVIVYVLAELGGPDQIDLFEELLENENDTEVIDLILWALNRKGKSVADRVDFKDILSKDKISAFHLDLLKETMEKENTLLFNSDNDTWNFINIPEYYSLKNIDTFKSD